MYKPNSFELYELLCKSDYEELKDNQFAWSLFDERMLRDIQHLRELFGKVTINDWKWGGDNQWRGLRNPASKWYSRTSQHSWGRAADLIFEETTAESVRQYILANPLEFEIKRMERDVSWLHIDYFNTGAVSIKLFSA